MCCVVVGSETSATVVAAATPDRAVQNAARAPGHTRLTAGRRIATGNRYNMIIIAKP